MAAISPTMTTAERVADHGARIEDQGKRLDGVEKRVDKLLWGIIATLLATLGGVSLQLFTLVTKH